MAEQPLAGGVAARGTSGRMPAPPRAPAARREQQVLFMRPCFCAGQGVAQRKTGCEEFATNERIKSLLFPAVSPACRGERTCTKRDGLRPERSTRSFPRTSWSKAKEETGAVCARRVRTRRVCLGTRALQGLTRWSGILGRSNASGSYSKMMRRLVPEQATEWIIGSPGGATSNGAAGVRRGLFQHGA